MAMLLPVPAGARAGHANGVLDLDGFVGDFFAPEAASEEKGVMTRRGFVEAARRAWIGTDGSQADIFLIQFTAATGAQSMYNGLSHSWQTDQSQGSAFTDSADQAAGRIMSKVDDLGNASVKLITARDSVVVFVHYYTAATPDQAEAEGLLHRQLDALSGGTAPRT